VKILYFHQHFTTPKGSSGTRSYEFAQVLIRRGHQVTMVCGQMDRDSLNLPFDEKRGWSRGLIDGIDVIALPLSYSNHDGIGRRLITFFKYALKSIKIALDFEYDVVFATSTPLTAALPGIFASWLKGKNFIFEVRDLWPELPKAMGMKNPILLGGMWAIEGCAYRASSACVGLSPGIVQGIRHRSAKNHPIALIPNGCDLEIFKPQPKFIIKIEGIKEGDFVAGFTGAHGKANGLDAIIEAARELKKRNIQNIKFLLIGDGSEKARLQKLATQEQLDCVIFHPPISKLALAQITSQLDCGLMFLDNIPAFYYGTSPNKFFDYISAGIPVINNYPGWLAGMITENQCGVAIPPKDTRALVDTLITLSREPSSCMKMGQSARMLAEKEFSREKLANQFCDFIEHQSRLSA
jgi:glycosyltransferase involved in cell wall biosynthesis